MISPQLRSWISVTSPTPTTTGRFSTPSRKPSCTSPASILGKAPKIRLGKSSRSSRRLAGLTAEIPREGERYDARQRRKEELVSAAWREGRADPRVANELDGFMAAASERLGEEGMRNASRAASSGRSMTVPGVGREHQAGLDELVRSFVQGATGWRSARLGTSGLSGRRKRPIRQRARAEERERGDCRQSRSRTESGKGRAWTRVGKVEGIDRHLLSSMPRMPSLMTRSGRGEHHHPQPR